MTAFNTDYNNTELLDQELMIEELEAVAGGARGFRGAENCTPYIDPSGHSRWECLDTGHLEWEY